MQRHTTFQLLGLVLFVLLGLVATVLGVSFTDGYLVGLLFGFAIGLSVAVFQYGIVVEIQSESDGVPSRVAQKIDDFWAR